MSLDFIWLVELWRQMQDGGPDTGTTAPTFTSCMSKLYQTTATSQLVRSMDIKHISCSLSRNIQQTDMDMIKKYTLTDFLLVF